MINKINVLTKLNKLRRGVHKAGIQPTGFNKYTKKKYYELSDMQDFINMAIQKLNISIFTSIQRDIGTITLVDLESGEFLELMTPFEISSTITDKAQGVGAGITYIRRYLYVLLLDLPEIDELDSLDYTKKNKRGIKQDLSFEDNQTQPTQSPQNPNNGRDIKWWDMNGEPELFDHYMVDYGNGLEIVYKIMRNKSKGNLFGLAVDEHNVPGNLKYHDPLTLKI